MKKLFAWWHLLKEKIEYKQNSNIYFQNGDIWWCHLGINVGDEEDGKGEACSRPVLIIKKFNKLLFWGVPLSKVLKKNPYYVICTCTDGKIRSAMISQLRLISVKRLSDKITLAERESYFEIKKAIKNLL